jgi:hypothetical protein
MPSGLINFLLFRNHQQGMAHSASSADISASAAAPLVSQANFAGCAEPMHGRDFAQRAGPA